ncbi:Delta(3,5)-Delta(2,4)-dienoyl-CoA isomerase [Yarrowia sp. E02]|nr:Delta(3,5)-Delta(2,4)-dienoyl-CoA isomerase [Yarrowia sp. E02]
MPLDYSAYDQFNISFPAEYVALVETNRPKSLNSYNLKTWEQFGQIFIQMSDDSDIRVIVFGGEGRAFCSGLDIKEMGGFMSGDEDMEASRKAIKFRRFITDFQDNIKQPHLCRKPIIAVCHGISFGLALDMISGMDIRIAAKDVKFSIKEADIGLTADMGTLQRLPKVINNLGWLKEVTYTARVFGAEEAYTQGLVTHVTEDKAAGMMKALEMAVLIAEKSPVAVQGSKETINYAIDHTIEDGLAQIANYNTFGVAGDTIEAAMSMAMKKKPTYEKL